MSFLHAKLCEPAVVQATCKARLLLERTVAKKREENLRIQEQGAASNFEQSEPLLKTTTGRQKKKNTRNK